MVFSPGVQFVARSLPQLVIPCVIGYGTLIVISDVLAISVPRWALLSFVVVSRGAHLFLKPFLNNRRNARDAKAHGAVLPPQIDVSPFEVPKKIIENSQNGYIG